MNALDAGPVVRAHLQEAAYGHAEPNPPAITEQDVQDHLIPPALCEVGQEVHEEELQRREKQIFCILVPFLNILLLISPHETKHLYHKTMAQR